MVEQAYFCQVNIVTILTFTIVLPLFIYILTLENVKYKIGNVFK